MSLGSLAQNSINPNGTWLYPDPTKDPVYNYLDTLNASWTSTFDSPWLHLWCNTANDNSTTAPTRQLHNASAPTSGYRLLPLNFNLASTNCHMEISPKPYLVGPPYLMSGSFGLTMDDSKPPVIWSQDKNPTTKSSTSQTTSTPTSSPSPASSPSSPASSPSPTVSSSSTSSSISSGAAAGVGIGVAAGVLLIAGLLFFAFRERRRRKYAEAQSHTDLTHHDTEHAKGPTDVGDSPWAEMPGQGIIHEKQGTPVVELEGREGGRRGRGW